MITIGVVVLKFANSMYLKYEGIKVNKFSFIARIYTCSTNEKSKLSCAHIFSDFHKNIGLVKCQQIFRSIRELLSVLYTMMYNACYETCST